MTPEIDPEVLDAIVLANARILAKREMDRRAMTPRLPHPGEPVPEPVGADGEPGDLYGPGDDEEVTPDGL